MKKILVVGSLNMDTVIETPRIPVPGETIMGNGIKHVPGGKGANQVYTIGKLGGDVSMIGAVGDDSFGDAMLDNLKSVNVNVEGIERIPGGTTGQAFIPVDANGENSIIVVGGTNSLVDEDLLKKYEYLMDEADIVVMQQEIPLDTVMKAKEMALAKGKTIIVDPAPAAAMPEEFWKDIDYIKPNETELGILIGRELHSKEEYKEAAHEMLKKGVKHLLVTLGSKGESSRYYGCGRLLYRSVCSGNQSGEIRKRCDCICTESVCNCSYKIRCTVFRAIIGRGA